MKMPQDVGTGIPTMASGAAQHRPKACTSERVPPESTAAYIADMTTQLAGLARGSQLDVLAYLLDIVQLEAASTLRGLARQANADMNIALAKRG